MIPSHLTPDQHRILAEIGHLHLVLESHKTAARFCREQLKLLRAQLEHTEQTDQPPAGG